MEAKAMRSKEASYRTTCLHTLAAYRRHASLPSNNGSRIKQHPQNKAFSNRNVVHMICPWNPFALVRILGPPEQLR
eukprot:3162829-Amphidinium_carterae.1